ncbi:hypothetical protein MTF69_01495 [Streptomyces sp. AP-93]|nr:hypothetical protein [Streptomyces sp. AP-93]
MNKQDADDLRTRHRDERHSGGTPDGEELTSNAASATDDPRALWITGAIFAFGALAWIWQQITGT